MQAPVLSYKHKHISRFIDNYVLQYIYECIYGFIGSYEIDFILKYVIACIR